MDKIIKLSLQIHLKDGKFLIKNAITVEICKINVILTPVLKQQQKVFFIFQDTQIVSEIV